jgi:ABC-2 type transport system permease protein
MSKAITEKPEERPAPGGWGPSDEVAPSVVREDEPGFARTLGMCGAALVIFGGMALAFNAAGKAVRVSPGWATFTLAVGLVGLMLHAAFERDLQIRRIYLGFGVLALAVGAFLCVLPYPVKGGQFAPGAGCMTLALFFLLATHHNETDPWARNVLGLVLGGAGAVLAAVGLFGGSLTVNFLLPYGLFLALLGLLYAASFVVVRGTQDDLAYWAGVAAGAGGALVFLVALVRSVLPALAHRAAAGAAGQFLIPQGLLLMLLGVLYVAVALGLCSDRHLVTMTRRELGAFFYSPVAYFVLLGFTLAAWINFDYFIRILNSARMGVPEPIVQYYVITFWPVLSVLVAVPLLTMRLLSEEQRTGTLEVLLTAPVGETTVVLSKFLAAFIMFMTVCVPFGVLLIALRVVGGQPFDYLPLLAFLVVLAATGAGFVGIGLFFSSLTRNQIASAVLTFAILLVLTFPYFLLRPLSGAEREGTWGTFLRHVSYLDAWETALGGRLPIQLLLFYGAVALFFLFVTVKKLEARKWL